MDNSRYKDIASTILDHDLVDPDHLKKAIAAHKKAVENGKEISFTDFLVEKGLVRPEDVESLLDHSGPESPSMDLDPPPENADISEHESVKGQKQEGNVYDQHTQRTSQSRRNRFLIIGAIIGILGIIVVYTYYQYSQSRSARKALQKARNLKEKHRYQEALDVISNQLLEPYPSSSAASDGKTLQANIRKILDRKQTVQSALDDIRSKISQRKTTLPEEELNHLTKTFDRVDDLYNKHATFLKNRFRSSTPSNDPDLLKQIQELRETLRKLARETWETVFEQKKKQIRKLIEQQKIRRAFESAKTFQKNYNDVRDPDTTPLSDLANTWISKEYRNTLRSVKEMVKSGKADQGLKRFREALSAYESFVSEERQSGDLKKLKKLRSQSSSKKQDSGGETAITGGAGEEERDTDGVSGARSDTEEEASSTTKKKKKTNRSEAPFNLSLLLTEEGSMIEGRIIRVNDQQVVVETGSEKTTITLDQLNPASATQALHKAGQQRKAIEYAIENQAYHAARTVLSGMENQDQTWQEASVNASNQFLDQVLQMSSETRREHISRKEKKLKEEQIQTLQSNEYKPSEIPVQSVERLVYTGDVSRRLDIVFVNDGWTNELQPKYNKLCERLVKRLLNVKPFINYKRYINFHRINVISEQTEIDGSTPLGTSVQGDDDRIISDYGKAEQAARAAPDTDLVVNVVNIEDGRATGTIRHQPGVITIDRSGRVGATFVHELGHAFGNLDDEYVEESKNRSYSREEEDRHINTSRVSDPLKVKWHYWAFPKPPTGRAVGTYEGAYYNAEGYYRPSPNCRMKSSSTRRFCVVCFEQMEKSFYHNVSPLDRVEPFRQSVEIFKNENRKLLAHTITTKARGEPFGALRANWYLNGRPLENTESTTLKTWVNTGSLSLPPGTHQLGVHIHFRNRRVRRDHGYLSDAHVWTVKVRPYEKPNIGVGDRRETRAGSPFELPLKLDGTSRKNGLRIKPLSLPPGARFDGDKTRINWTPTPRQTGSHSLRVGVVDPNRENEVVLNRTIRLTVKPNGRKNESPLMYVPPVMVVEEGEPMNDRIRAWDPDNDFLTYRVSGSPNGLTLKPNSGRLHWKVDYRNPFRKKMTVTVTDGQTEVSKDMQLVVKDQPLPDVFKRSGYSAMSALRSRNAGVVMQVFRDKLKNLPRLYQFMESIRLLRHRESSVRNLAIDRVRSIFESRKPAMKERYIHILFSTVKPHMFHFTDSPQVLSFLQSMVNLAQRAQAASSKAKTIGSRLDTIRKYNKKRGVDLDSSD